MDPISALSVAAAAVQFVDFSFKCITGMIDAYQSISRNGAPAAYENLKVSAERMYSSNSRLLKSLNQDTLLRELNESETEVSAIATECTTSAITLLDAMRGFQIPKIVDKKWLEKLPILKAAVKSVWNRDKLETLQGKLKASREELLFMIVLDLR
jgi:hypothetical protein